MKVAGLEGSGDTGTGISVSDCFDVIKLWHRNKPVDPAIGVKLPKVTHKRKEILSKEEIENYASNYNKQI